MERANTAYVLDPETTIFKPVGLPVSTGIRPVYELIGCRLLEVVRFDERHTLLVDEEGLKEGLTAFTIFEGFPQPIAGKIVLVGGDGSSPYTSPLVSLEDAGKHFKCCRPVLDPVFAKTDEISPGGIIIAGALAGLQSRIERRAPTLVEGEA
ncbi:hypothetical protein N183_24300 [Sinorhizobium sp. Sb3]|uniref:DUF3846 domain-containing protein n=1 Tax=Sinorhizobium sp. Sb3 TaxID=1358417 RepID=UPI00071D10E9|nr:protein psiB [Sinorhizobium sp. Sb3]KSV73559.1 hypothetical protein N183_24300 [Sinorhizobium sp. Sb3]